MLVSTGHACGIGVLPIDLDTYRMGTLWSCHM